MKLYYHPLSTYAQKVLTALYEKGIEFEPHIVQLMDQAESAKYREIYPMGKVPLLVLDDGYMIPESSIIIEYLDSVTGPQLIPSDPERGRKTRFKDRMFDQYLIESIGTLFFQGLKPEAARDQERIDKAKFRIGVTYQFMNEEFGKQPFANGDEFLMSDCAGAAGLFYAPQLAPFEEHEHIKAYWERVKQRPSIQRVHKEAAPYLEEMLARQDVA